VRAGIQRQGLSKEDEKGRCVEQDLGEPIREQDGQNERDPGAELRQKEIVFGLQRNLQQRNIQHKIDDGQEKHGVSRAADFTFVEGLPDLRVLDHEAPGGVVWTRQSTFEPVGATSTPAGRLRGFLAVILLFRNHSY